MKKGIIGALLSVALLVGAQVAAAETLANGAEPMAEAGLSVNINLADAETIASVLVGVGVEKARAIVAYREQHGRFYLAEEHSAVKGIGEGTLLKNAARIRVDDKIK